MVPFTHVYQKSARLLGGGTDRLVIGCQSSVLPAGLQVVSQSSIGGHAVPVSRWAVDRRRDQN